MQIFLVDIFATFMCRSGDKRNFSFDKVVSFFYLNKIIIFFI